MVPSRAALFGSCLAILFGSSLCVVYRSQPTSTSNCSTACGSGVSVNNACLVLGSNSTVYTNFGNLYANSTGGPYFCVTPSTSSANFSCVCAESISDYRTVPLSAGTSGDCASACLYGNNLRNTSWTFQNSFGTLGPNYIQYGYAFCNVSRFSWGMHPETKVWQRASNGTVSVLGLNGYLGPVLQDWTDNGTSICSVPYVDQSTYTAYSTDYSNGTDCLCVSFLSPMVAGNFNASDLPNQAYTSKPLPALPASYAGNLQESPSTAALPEQSSAPPVSAPSSAMGSGSTSPSVAPAGAQTRAPAPSPSAPVLPIPQGNSSNTGAIVGGAVGGAVAAIALAGLIFCLVRRWVGRGAAGSTLEDDNPWAVREEKPFWKKLLAPASTHSSATTKPGSDAESMKTGMSYFTQDVKALKSIPLASQTQTNYGLMRVEDLDLLAAGTATTALRQQEGPRNTSSAFMPSGNSPSLSTKDTIAMVDSDLPVQLRNTWQISLDQLQLVMDAQQRPVTLGKGAYGTVYLGILDGVRKVAVKIVNSPTQRHQKRFVQEIATLRACYDSNIVSFLGASVQEGNTLLVMEFMANGNLWDALQHDSSNEFRWYGRGRRIALDITAGMSFLHRNDIVHLDLKSPNVLLDENNKAHVADIGLGKMLAGQDALASAATFFWAAPEQLQAQPVSKASDIFSLGVIIWEIVTGDQPLQRVYRDVRVPEECPAGIAAMLTACLSTTPADRPTINQVYKTMRDAPAR